MSDGPRAYTAEEMRDEFIAHVHGIARYWATVDTSKEEALMGLAFSFLVVLDGGNAGLPAYDLTPAPHPDDEAFCRDEEHVNWYPSNVVINANDQLHELFATRYPK